MIQPRAYRRRPGVRRLCCHGNLAYGGFHTISRPRPEGAQIGAEMNRYDALKTPEPEIWLALEEESRIALVEDYHKRTEGRIPRLRLHSMFHNIAETQLAMGLPKAQ